MICRRTILAFTGLTLSASVSAIAQGNISAWTSSEEITAPAARGGSGRILKAAPIDVPNPTRPPPVGVGAITTRAPAAAVPTLPSSVPAGDTTVAKTGTGGDTAYEAFDQGRYLTALELAKAAVERGEPTAATLAGRIFQEGLGVPRDEVQAAQWYRRGAELGDVNAMFAFGVMLAEGGAIKKDHAGAAKMFEQAASKGHVAANYNLALLFLSGDGKPENPQRAFAHLLYAAEAGLPQAQYDLATLYATGTGVAANAVEEANWLQRAAASGLADAQLHFGVILFQGKGLAPDQKRGAEMFRLAAEKGNPLAQDRFARCHAYGAGVAVNPAEAAKWYVIAKAGGIEDKVMEQWFAKLAKTDRTRAEQAAIEWREKSVMQ